MGKKGTFVGGGGGGGAFLQRMSGRTTVEKSKIPASVVYESFSQKWLKSQFHFSHEYASNLYFDGHLYP